MDQPREDAKPARGQLNREIKCPYRCIRGNYIDYVYVLLFAFVYIPGIFFIWVHVYSCTVHCCTCISVSLQRYLVCLVSLFLTSSVGCQPEKNYFTR